MTRAAATTLRGNIVLLAILLAGAGAARADVDEAVLAAESERVEVIERASRAAIAIFAAGGQGGGSGVVISSDGYAISNFHVVQPVGHAFKCGMADGGYYDGVVVGLDPTGDVALVKLFGRDDFPTAQLGDSDQVRQGDWVFAVGNPFLLATNFHPSVSYGIVSGTHRYQYPAGTLLEYTDCIQTDAAINPGNSGGPLFNSRGELIGVNGRGSFEKRGRVNVGVGYAISINQIKNFLGYLESGRIVDHASLGARVATDFEGRVVVRDILTESDAYRRGLRMGDEVVEFAGRPIRTANALKNVLGIFPKGWRVPLAYRRGADRFEIVVRLAGAHRTGELVEQLQAAPDESPRERRRERLPDDEPPDQQQPSEKSEPPAEEQDGSDSTSPESDVPNIVAEHYQSRPGYANYYFNRLERSRVWNAFLTSGDFANFAGDWVLSGQLPAGGDITLELGSRASVCRVPAGVTQLEMTTDLSMALDPPGSGGMLAAFTLWRQLLVTGPEKFGDVYYLGAIPLVQPGAANAPLAGPSSAWREGRQVDVLVAVFASVECRFLFDRSEGRLLIVEYYPRDDVDPCELHFSDYQEQGGRWLPRQVEVRRGDDLYAAFVLDDFQLSPGGEEQP